ncbi:ABC transporter permease [Albimonas sp. CAU 1670]|uniref:ABC transporter permease n=1 Tax=Albimonas sp. CAU 1670 TaxID=3032599 RepID=UPI0023D9A3E3|nr:ABC transporter permease [Albimonas sp. CAU 1670]MDF2231681.1 ABC transporter permease [Albimonas sp. CAU 1670]
MEGSGDRLGARGLVEILDGAELGASLAGAARLVLSLDPELLDIGQRSLGLALLATFAACLIGLPTGMALAFASRSGRRFSLALLSGLGALPSAVVGLAAALALAATPAGRALPPAWAVVFAQVLLVLPLVVAGACRAMTRERLLHAPALRALRVGRLFALATLAAEARPALVAAALAAFARALGTTGAALAAGGAIPQATQVIAPALALGPSAAQAASPAAFLLGLGLALAAASLALHALGAALSHRAEAPTHA